MKRRGYENLTTRLAKRECVGVPPGATAVHARRYAENVVPDTAVPGLAPPPNTVIHSFSPCGRYLIAFQPVTSEVVAFRFKGLHTSSTAAEARGGSGGSAAVAGEPHQQRPSAPQPAALPEQHAAGSNRQAAAQQQGAPPSQSGGVAPLHAAFSEVFEEAWRCCPCPSRHEQISPEFCAVAHDRFLLVCTASPERPPPVGAWGAAELVPHVDRTTFHLLELGSGCLVDSLTLRGDFVELSRGQGAHLRGQLLLVLGLASQTLHVVQVLPAGRLLYLHAVGQHCRDDDALVIAQHEAAERRLRQQQERQRQRQQQAAPSHAASAASLSSLSRTSAEGGSAGGMQAGSSGAGAPGAGMQQHQGSGPSRLQQAAAPAVRGVLTGVADADSDSDGDWAGQQAGGAAGAEGASPLLGGLKQCLLAYLYREAQQQAAAAAAAAASAAACSGACAAACGSTRGGGDGGASGAGHRGISGAGGSTASLLSAAVPSPKRLVAGGVHGSSSTGSLGDGGGDAHHWRRPLDRFCYYFQAYCELLMWKAQLLDDHRLLVHWCPPDILGGPHHRHGHTASGGASSSYVMLYNLASAAVERLFVAHSSEFAAWYLSHPAAFSPAGCACGCGTGWERCVVPPGASRVAREQQQRDPLLAVKDLRQRLSDELPLCSQLRQASPYLDPDLFCFDERVVGGPIRPHHPPHRSIKFMCRCQPERLRFRIDPEHLAPPAPASAGSAGGRGATRPRHIVYLFHPYQPFLLVVSQDVESCTAEHLTVFSRL